MRTTKLLLLAAAAASTMLACTVKDVDTPTLAGPSTLARQILMTADRTSVTQDGSDFATITLRSLVQPGQPDTIRARAQVFVDGVAQDFGTLSNKFPIITSNPSTITYRAPAAPLTVGGQVPTVVTIVVTPEDNGDFRAEVSRSIDLRLVPPGVILPSNPNLVADFTVTPEAPKVMDTVTFNASTSTNNGAACLTACLYSWNFGDGTTASGITATHQFRTIGNAQVLLTVTDNRGAAAQALKIITVAEGAPPELADFIINPSPATPNQDVFFSAVEAKPAPGRRIVSYEWIFGDGATGSGVTTTHRYSGVGEYTVVLKITDDAGTVLTLRGTVTINTTSGTTASLSVTPSAPRVGQQVLFDASGSTPGAGSSIVSYKFDFGDGTIFTTDNPRQSYVYTGTGTVNASVEVTDSLGRTAIRIVPVTVAP